MLNLIPGTLPSPWPLGSKSSESLVHDHDYSPPPKLPTTRAFKDGVLPLSEPIRGADGRMISEITVPAGTTVQIGIMACNRSKKIWGEDAEEWKPERWLSPLPASVEKAHVPGVYANLYVKPDWVCWCLCSCLF